MLKNQKPDLAGFTHFLTFIAEPYSLKCPTKQAKRHSFVIIQQELQNSKLVSLPVVLLTVSIPLIEVLVSKWAIKAIQVTFLVIELL